MLQFDTISLGDSSISLLDVRSSPPIVAKIECDVVRGLTGKTEISELECRALIESNRGLVTEIAKTLFAQNRVCPQGNQVRRIDIGLPELKPVASRFATSVLDASLRWTPR